MALPTIPRWLTIAQLVVLFFPFGVLVHIVSQDALDDNQHTAPEMESTCRGAATQRMAQEPSSRSHSGMPHRSSLVQEVHACKMHHATNADAADRVEARSLSRTVSENSDEFRGAAKADVKMFRSKKESTDTHSLLQVGKVLQVPTKAMLAALQPSPGIAVDKVKDELGLSTVGFWGFTFSRRRSSIVGAAIVGFGLLQTRLRSAVVLTL